MAVSNGFIDLNFKRKLPQEQDLTVSTFTNKMKNRKKVHSFSKESVPEEVIEKVIHAAGTSPSGANQQPWKFALVKDKELKKAIRVAAEAKEDTPKEYLEEAPYLIAVFRENYGLQKDDNGEAKKVRHYYALESTAISTGFLLAALQHAELDYILHTPFNELSTILTRPKNETPIALFAVGFGSDVNASPQAIGKPLSELVFGDIDVSGSTLNTIETGNSDKDKSKIATEHYETIKKRRNIRDFSTEDISESLIIKSLEAAITTPSYRNLQPYRFAVIKDAAMKKLIREQAEIEEKKLYEERISDEWKEALAPLGTNWMKAHLTDAPYLIIAFKVDNTEGDSNDTGEIVGAYDKHHSLTTAGMAVGVLLGALHHAGVCTLTHTPSPMVFLRDLLDRPKNEMPILVLPVGYPVDDCKVPDITKKPLNEILVTY